MSISHFALLKHSRNTNILKKYPDCIKFRKVRSVIIPKHTLALPLVMPSWQNKERISWSPEIDGVVIGSFSDSPCRSLRRTCSNCERLFRFFDKYHSNKNHEAFFVWNKNPSFLHHYWSIIEKKTSNFSILGWQNRVDINSIDILTLLFNYNFKTHMSSKKNNTSFP